MTYDRNWTPADDPDTPYGQPPRDLDFWIIGDTHFRHDNIVAFSARPEHHDELMVEQWRARVAPDDLVVHLGDLCWHWDGGPEWFAKIASDLPGRKLMLVGNHDHEQASYYADCGFELIRPFGLDGPASWRLNFTHYPDGTAVLGENALNVHGHIHTKLEPNTRYLNLSVEWTDYVPVRIEAAVTARIAAIDGGHIDLDPPLPYDAWLTEHYGAPTTRLDTDRWPDDIDRCLHERRLYTKYRLAAAPLARIGDR